MAAVVVSMDGQNGRAGGYNIVTKTVNSDTTATDRTNSELGLEHETHIVTC